MQFHAYILSFGGKSWMKVKLLWKWGCSKRHSVIGTTRLDLGHSLYQAMLNTL